MDVLRVKAVFYIERKIIQCYRKTGQLSICHSKTSQLQRIEYDFQSPNFLSLHLRHNSFFNPSVALPTSQLILQPFCCFTYVTAHSPTLLSLLLRHRLFTYVTWRTAHGYKAWRLVDRYHVIIFC